MSETPQGFVFYAGTSASTRETLQRSLVLRGLAVRTLASAADHHDRHGAESCSLLVVDLDGDAAAARQSLAGLRQQHPQTPLLAIVEHGDVAGAVQAMKAGASHCLQRPIDMQQLTSAMDELLGQADLQTDHAGLPLTPTEITVLRLIVQGKTSRQIAKTLCRSPRTIEVHRSHIMRKLHASTMVDLVRAASAMGFLEEPSPGGDFTTTT